MIQDFSPWGVYYLEIACGENARAALDYTLHYRSPRMIGIDADYSMSQDYAAQSWPTFVVIDAEGVIQFHGFDTDQNLAGVRRCLQKILKASPKDQNQTLENGVAYPADVLAARKALRERSPRLAFDRSGNPLVVFYSNRAGTNAVFVRQFSPEGAPVDDRQISPPGMESYAPDCVCDSAGALWATWCGRTNRFWDIFVFHEGATGGSSGSNPSRIEQLTMSDDDAMCPRIAAGPQGAVTVAYYKWAKLNGISRDRNIHARSWDPVQHVWGPEKEISPPEPKVEDHTDPDVVVDKEGQAWVVWSYDYHPQLFSKPVDAAQPTIFAASFASSTVGPAVLVGATGSRRYAIDLFPSAALDRDGVLWCAWDCSEPHRTIELARRVPADNSFKSAGTFGKAICSTPELSTAGEDLLLCWSEHAPVGKWQGKVTLLHEGKAGPIATFKEEGDVLFLQAQQNSQGQYWVVFENCSEKGAQVVLRRLENLK